MVGWHHQLNGHGFGQTLENSEGHGGLACCRPGGHKESDMTEQLNNNCLKGLLPFGRALGPHPFSTVAFGNGAWLLTIQAELLFLVPLQENGGWLGGGKGAIVLLSGISELVKNFKQGGSVEVVTFLAWGPAGLTVNALCPLPHQYPSLLKGSLNSPVSLGISSSSRAPGGTEDLAREPWITPRIP